MKGGDVIVFKVNLDKGFPVVVALMNFNVIQDVIRKIKLWTFKQVTELGQRFARALKQQAMTFFQRKAFKVQAGRVLKVWGA